MNMDESLRILGVPADSTPEQIRQAYLDLVRVWHPDRFQSDFRLRQIAEQHLCKINEAYSELKNYRPPAHTRSTSQARTAETHGSGSSRTAGSAGSATEGASQRETPTWTAQTPRASFGRPSYLLRFIRGKVARATTVAVLCLAPFLAVAQVVRLLRVPVVDANLIAARALKPDILTPMRIIDPLSEVRVAADAMTEWARGEAIDLWRPASPGPQPAIGSSGTIPDSPQQPVGGLGRSQAKRPNARVRAVAVPGTTFQQPAPRNGAELIDGGRASGVGDLRLVNHTNLEAIVKVVRNRSTWRAIYVTPNHSAILRSMRIGVYDLQVELGTDLDFEHMRFRKNRYTPEPLGPFEFLEITSENGITGKHYEVALNPR